MGFPRQKYWRRLPFPTPWDLPNPRIKHGSRGLADVADRYIRKGSQIYVEGRIRTREWTDRDNQKRTGVEILADELKLLGRRNDAPAQGQYSGGGNMGAGNSIIEPATHSSSYTAPEPKAPSVDDDLPF